VSSVHSQSDTGSTIPRYTSLLTVIDHAGPVSDHANPLIDHYALSGALSRR
jgi:hypothetical protein